MKMHEPYDEENEEEDNYDDYDHYNYPQDNTKWYYKFDVNSDTPVSKWINDIVNNFMGSFEDKIDTYWGSINSIPGFPYKKFPVNSWNPNTANNKFQYLGSNYAGSPIWKTQYFLIDTINTSYKLHLQSHAKHFVQQPHYYNGMFDILN